MEKTKSSQSKTELNQLIEISDQLNQVTSGKKRVEYTVPNLGKVREEIEIYYQKMAGSNNERRFAFHKVYINDELVRETDLNNNKIILSNKKYEPYNFLHMNMETYKQMLRQNAITG